MANVTVRYDGHDYTVRNAMAPQVLEQLKQRLEEPARYGQWFTVSECDDEVRLLVTESIAIAIVG